MSNKLKKKNNATGQAQKESVFKEAWDNMNNDMAKVLPAFVTRRLQKKEGKLWVMVVVTLVELIVLGVVGKLLYDWFVASS